MAVIFEPASVGYPVAQDTTQGPYGTAIPDTTQSDKARADAARAIINTTLDRLDGALHKVNTALHLNPETAYQEVFAHKTSTEFLEDRGFAVQRHAWGLDTAFEAAVGDQGRQVIFCAEYDALPDIGHACGHNLIATASLAAFLGAAQVLSDLKIPGRLRILGTPAEEGGGGKIRLIEAGAFDPPEDVAAAIMSHPTGSGPNRKGEQYDGLAGTRLIASYKMRVEFRGRTSHAGAEPWKGVNALDAAVAGYVNVSMLRQQIQPDERVHGVFDVGGTVPNVIPDYASMSWCVRSPTHSRCEALVARVKACLEAGAKAAGCEISYEVTPAYRDLRINSALCKAYVDDMAKLGLKVEQEDHVPFEASTDMGNISYLVPSFHGAFPIPTPPDVSMHNSKFAACAGTEEAHESAIRCAKGMAMLAIRVLTEDGLARRARRDFEKTSEKE